MEESKQEIEFGNSVTRLLKNKALRAIGATSKKIKLKESDKKATLKIIKKQD